MPQVRNDRKRRRVLDMYADGHTLKEIAKAIGCSSHGYAVRIIAEAREAGDRRAMPRRPNAVSA